MTPIDRNPDVNLEKNEPVPAGCYLHEGKALMVTARACKPPVPYGLAVNRRYVPGTSESRMETVGIIVRLADRERFTEALARKTAKQPVSQ